MPDLGWVSSCKACQKALVISRLDSGRPGIQAPPPHPAQLLAAFSARWVAARVEVWGEELTRWGWDRWPQQGLHSGLHSRNLDFTSVPSCPAQADGEGVCRWCLEHLLSLWKAVILNEPGRGSVQFSHSVVSDSLRPHEPQHARPPCPSPTPGVHPNPCPLCHWCHPTISSSVVPFSSCPHPASGSFPMSQLSTSGGQSIGVSASASVPPMNTQDWSPLGWTGWISLQPKGLSRVFSNTTVQKHQFFCAQLSL